MLSQEPKGYESCSRIPRLGQSERIVGVQGKGSFEGLVNAVGHAVFMRLIASFLGLFTFCIFLARLQLFRTAAFLVVIRSWLLTDYGKTEYDQ